MQKPFGDILLFLVLLIVVLMISFPGEGKHSSASMKRGMSKSATIPDSLFKSGDLIFREGRGVLSSVFRRLSLKDPSYSHAGILHREGGHVYVYHVIGEENSESVMRKDPIEEFISPAIANSYAVYRTDQDERLIDSIAGHYFESRVSFDNDFDLSTDNKMYCTELLYKILLKTSRSEKFLPLTVLSGKEYVACDNIYLSPHMNKIYSHQY